MYLNMLQELRKAIQITFPIKITNTLEQQRQCKEQSVQVSLMFAQ